MDGVALATKVFKRPDDLVRLLRSVPKDMFEHIYIADDGEDNPAQAALSEVELETDVTVFNLEFDAGNGFARREIVDRTDEEHLLMVDADHTIPENVDVLYQQLGKHNSLGGIAGSVVEPGANRVWQSGKDLYERAGGLVRTADTDPDVQYVAGYPLTRFDFVPQAVLFKRACLDSYAWDRNYVTHREHLDFFLGHWRRSEWEFAVSPAVFFGHYPGGNVEYESHRHSERKGERDHTYFLEKWDYDFLQMGDPYWFDTASQGCHVRNKIRRRLIPLKHRLLQTVRRQKNI